MKRISLFAVALLFPFAFTEGGEWQQASGNVYICTGGSSKKYHSTPDCRGLNNCQGSIRQISLQKAKEMGRTACKICY